MFGTFTTIFDTKFKIGNTFKLISLRDWITSFRIFEFIRYEQIY